MAGKIKPAAGPSLTTLQAMMAAGAVSEDTAAPIPAGCGANLANRLFSRAWVGRAGSRWWVTTDGLAAVAASETVDA